eukprot:GHRR01019532.1.p1 GENE.GHRR01019532.1~~GHRR01019532.1.p1  ORF type:complete len:407 (+),score=200.79 GHRR01019532.1:341-1561(+)
MEDGREAKRARTDGDLDHRHRREEEQYPGQHPGPAVNHVAGVAQDPAAVAAVGHVDQQLHAAADRSLAAAGPTDQQLAQPPMAADAAQVAQAAAAAAQAAQLNADAAQQAAQHAAQQHLDLQHLVAVQTAVQNMDPAALAAAGIPVSAGLTAQLDPAAAAAALAAQGINIQGLPMPGITLDHNGQQLHVMPDGLQLQAAHNAEMYAAAAAAAAHHHAGGHDEMAEMQRQHIETTRKADYQALAAAKRTGQLATINFTLDLPQELADVELTERNGIIEVPINADVLMLKRLFQYQAHNKLLPALQTLLTDQMEEMQDVKDDGTTMPLAHYNIGNGSSIILKITIPDELENVPMVDEALASAAYTSASSSARTPSRKTRWTTEQIEALIEGVEKYGLSAWRTIVMVRG